MGTSPDFGALAAILPARDQAVIVMVNAPRVNMPGAAGAVDRIAAGAVSILMGSEPATGPTMRSYYRVFNLLVGGALLVIFIGIAAALRPRPSRKRGWRRLLQVVIPPAAPRGRGPGAATDAGERAGQPGSVPRRWATLTALTPRRCGCWRIAALATR